MNRFKQEQEAFNRQLIETIKKQEDFIKSSIEKRDCELMEGLRKLQEQKRLTSEGKQLKKKKWWRFGQ